MDKKLIPVLRSDLQLNTYEHEGEIFAVISDPFGYAITSRTLHANAYNLLVSFAQEMSEDEMREIFKTNSDDPELVNHFWALVQQLDKDGFMLSEHFIELKTRKDMEYLALDTRPSICAGSSYPAEKEEITQRLNKLFKKADTEKFADSAKAIVAPHLDLRLGGELDVAYASAYHSILNTEADVYIIIGTSHMIANDYFMFTEKDYETPLGKAKIDMDLINGIDEVLGDYMTIDDLAHKIEHSIEYQVLLLQHYFKKDITILPILTGSLYDEMEQKDSEISSVRYNKIIEGIKTTLEKQGKKAVFIASADLAHIGRKFGDEYDASAKLEELEEADLKMLEELTAGSETAFLKNIFDCDDKWKVCGTAPITAIAKLADYEKAEMLNYNIWNEEETKSAVSFAALKFV